MINTIMSQIPEFKENWYSDKQIYKKDKINLFLNILYQCCNIALLFF